jgi:hypothetical protein
MMQPTIRFKKVHAPEWGDGVIDEGVSYEPKVLWIEFTTAGSGYSDFLYVPPGTYIEEAVLIITEALDTGALLDLGTDGNDDALIDNSDISADAVGVADSSTTAAMGMYFEDEDLLRLTVTNDTDQGTVLLKLTWWQITEMTSQGYHNEVTVGG